MARLTRLRRLETLVFYEPGELSDLGPLAALRNLTALEFSGGMDAVARADTLAPLGRLQRLETLRLHNLRVAEGGLRPLAGCAALRRLDASNQFETADYACLLVMLPRTDCELFAPFLRLERPIGDANVMVTGNRKPFLDATRDAARLEKYCHSFMRLQDEVRANRP